MVGLRYTRWRLVLGLISAFTVGHCITLVLAAKKMVVAPAYLVEIAIPASIVLACMAQLFRNGRFDDRYRFQWVIILFFGLIHGLGFANTLRSILGKAGDLWIPLLGFNLGLEVGQIFCAILLLMFNELVIRILKDKSGYFNTGMLLLVALSGFYLAWTRI